MIGVLGATGSVGSAAVVHLHRLGAGPLRIGARRRAPLEKLAADVPAETVPVDVRDPVALAAFTAGCTIVLNCAGPTYELKETVARAALAAGAHCVDVAGDDPVREALHGRDLGDRTVLLSAGTLPGLSNLLPRWLAGTEFDRVEALSAWVGGVEHCSPVVAVDMLLSLQTGGAGGEAYGEANAAWRAGGPRARALRPAEDVVVPMFPGPVAVQPFLSAETRRLAATLGLTTLDWFNVYPGPAVRALLTALPAAAREGADRQQLADRMIRAATVDLAGRQPYYQMVFTLRGSRAGQASEARVVLRTPSSYRLTGLVGALATVAVHRGAVPPGVHYAAEVLDPAAVVDAVRAAGEASVRIVSANGDDEEEGSL
ncbi:saccharopine dehydrogenase NADP-binding domain-containing protein [Micromonospora sp. WMMD961]|uniref:saccharopine dehydrogenase NADP-binding domain-containing protein n=1 Tax=Micromonospora sp. WMMD961 TaxID=3016100 RepID=UPI002416D928|nr:saccharopine dehydrogenase NADP-binding domain-containing protein [Micromonospora sp. WMMD961]MDG4782316.1 saccharopine dehydrogenase NADP-binding domain-containing protein [Micromonospora sp. WMMD961]